MASSSSVPVAERSLAARPRSDLPLLSAEFANPLLPATRASRLAHGDLEKVHHRLRALNC